MPDLKNAAAYFDVSLMTVYRGFRRAGLTPPNPKRKLTPEAIKDAEEKGLMAVELAIRCDAGRSAVAMHQKRQGRLNLRTWRRG